LNEKLRKSIVLAVLIGALIMAYFHFDGRDGKKAGRLPSRQTDNAEEGSALSPETSFLPVETARKYGALPWGKNPFYHSYQQSGTEIARKKIELHLLGILYRQVNARALINKTVVREGDTIAGYTVEKITRDHVTVSDGKTTLTLRVEKERS